MNILRPILTILILFIPLYPKFPITSVQGTYVAIRLDDIVVTISILSYFIYQLIRGFPIFKTKVTKLFIAYFLAIITSTLNAILIYQTDPQNILLLHLLRRFEYISLFFIAISTIKTKKDLIFPYITTAISTTLVCFYAYGQKYLHLPVVSTMNSEFSKGQLLEMSVWTRVSGTFAGHYDLAAYLSVVLIIIFFAFLTTRNIFFKILNLFIWLFCFIILTYTASRISIFAFWGGIIITLFLLRKYIWIIPVSIIIIYSIISSTDLKQRLLATIPTIKRQPTPVSIPTITETTPTIAPQLLITTPLPVKLLPTPIPTVIRHGPTEEYMPIDPDVGVARSGQIRFNAEWPRAITAFRKNFLLGTGLGSITLATDNDYLRLLGESGFFGFASFITILVFFIRKSLLSIFKKDRSFLDQVTITLFGSLLVTMANAVFIDVFEASKTAYMFWIMMGIYYKVLEINKAKNP